MRAAAVTAALACALGGIAGAEMPSSFYDLKTTTLA
jgi:hypothetical protein